LKQCQRAVCLGAPLGTHLSLGQMETGLHFTSFLLTMNVEDYGFEKFIATLHRVTLIECVHYISSNQTSRHPAQTEISEGSVLTNLYRDAT